jgi:hypothetical protein
MQLYSSLKLIKPFNHSRSCKSIERKEWSVSCIATHIETFTTGAVDNAFLRPILWRMYDGIVMNSALVGSVCPYSTNLIIMD